MIEKHYTKKIDIHRLATVTGAKKSFGVVTSNVPCHIQPYTGDITQDIQGSFGKDFLMFCAANVDIQDEDRIFEGAKEYRVLSIEKFEFMNQCKHQEVRMRVFE